MINHQNKYSTLSYVTCYLIKYDKSCCEYFKRSHMCISSNTGYNGRLLTISIIVTCAYICGIDSSDLLDFAQLLAC